MRGSAVFRTGVAPGGALAGPWVRDPLWARARAVPSLDLRFADNKSLVDATTGAQLVTFTRASSGTFVGSNGLLQSAANDVPRFDHNPTTGESLGLLVEEQMTNLATWSEDFSNAPWIANVITITTNTETAPNGTLTADTIAPLSGTSSIHTVITCLASTVHTWSFYVKLGTMAAADFRFAVRDDTNGVFIAVDIAPNVTPVTTEWRRVTYTFTTPVGCVLVRPYLYRFVPSVYGTTAHIWGAQLEVGAFPTSYIPTTTAAATRSADVASITGSAFTGFYRQDAQTWFGEYATIYNASATVPPASAPHLMQVYTAAAVNNNYGIRGAEANVTQLAVARNPISGVQFLGITLGFALAGQSRRLAYAINSSELQLAGMGSVGSLTINNSAALMTTHDILSIGFGTGGGAPQQLNGHIRRLCYWPQRLGNQVLQSITQ